MSALAGELFDHDFGVLLLGLIDGLAPVFVSHHPLTLGHQKTILAEGYAIWAFQSLGEDFDQPRFWRFRLYLYTIYLVVLCAHKDVGAIG